MSLLEQGDHVGRLVSDRAMRTQQKQSVVRDRKGWREEAERERERGGRRWEDSGGEGEREKERKIERDEERERKRKIERDEERGRER